MTRLLAALFGARCPLCLERHRHLFAHFYVDHHGEAR